MTWPSSDVPTTGMDAGTDTPPRSTFLAWAQAFNQMRAHVTTFMQGLLGSADAATARATLDVPSRAGGNATGTWGISISGNAATATTAANVSRSVTGAGLATGGGALSADQVITVPKATQAQAEAGTDDATAMTPLCVKQAIAYQSPALGVGQAWQDVRASRTWDTAYQNTTGKPICVILSVKTSSAGREFQVSQNNSTWITTHTWSQDGVLSSHSVVIPPGWYYRQAGGAVTLLDKWVELR